MPWNWELPKWPQLHYDSTKIAQQEKQFLLNVGSGFAFLKNISEQEYGQFMVEILSIEGAESSKIEGEILDRESLQSSIKRHFGLQPTLKKEPRKESCMAQALCHVYESFNQPLTHEMLWKWHAMLFDGSPHMHDCGQYRTHAQPMQIVSRRYGSARVFFEAPPSIQVPAEMAAFVDWYNSKQSSGSILGRAAASHVYFETIHPFEDGNGRIGRMLVEKILSQSMGRPILIAVSKVLEKRKKEYYSALEKCNRTLDIQEWVEFFAYAILQAQEESMQMLDFLIQKSKILSSLSGHINPRQEKVLLRMFAEEPAGFKGGLSAENYIAITKASRATATRDLADLVERGVLVKTGELRHTRYRLNLTRTQLHRNYSNPKY